MKRTLVVLTLLVTFASAASAQTQSSSPPLRKVPTLEPDAAAIREIIVGAAVPSGQNFAITLNERNIDWVYPEWVRPLLGAWTTAVTKEQFRAVVRDVASRKLAARFPHGFSPDETSKMGIEIKLRLKLSQPPEIDITIGC